MLRFLSTAARYARCLPASPLHNAITLTTKDVRHFSAFKNIEIQPRSLLPQNSLLANKQILDISMKIDFTPTRSVTKFSLKKGKRKTVKAVIKRFFRLHWGGWIRTKIGRHKKLWKKSSANKRRLRQHVFCNSTQNTLLDKMVTKYWKRPKHYVEDPYAPYHTREEFHFTRKQPIQK